MKPYNKIFPISFILLSILFVRSSTAQPVDASSFYRPLPYPISTYITDFKWVDEPSRYPGTNSDMHWWTWGDDSALYVVDDDGKNFGGPDTYAHLLKCTGIPPTHKVTTVTDFMGYPFRDWTPLDKLYRRYICGVVAVKNMLYATLYDYDWDIATHKLPFDTLSKFLKMYNPWPNLSHNQLKELGFIDGYSKLAGVAGIISSKDKGKTWENIPVHDTPQFFGNKFGAPAFLTFGPGNNETPLTLKPYVYAISNDGSWETGDHVRMAKVHEDSVVYRNAWQFLSGFSRPNIPQWSKAENEMRPIFTDLDHVGHPTITYNKAIKRYILCISSDVVPHSENSDTTATKRWDMESEMQLYESENPWGPWKNFYAVKPWGGKDHTCYIPQIPTPWLSKDGLSGYVLYAGDYVKRAGDYYGFMTQKFKLKINKRK